MNLVAVCFSIAAVMIWSSCLEPVPPIFILLGPAALVALMKSCAVLYGASALTQSTNWSSAIIFTGVSSFQLNGTPVASGVVNRFDSVMMILCGSAFAPLMSRKPSAPAPPPLLTTTIGCFIRLFLAITLWTKRAIWSAPPPVPAGTTNSTVLVGVHACACTGAATTDSATAPAASMERNNGERRGAGARRPGKAGEECTEGLLRCDRLSTHCSRCRPLRETPPCDVKHAGIVQSDPTCGAL